jgi:hypothetical protein
MVHKYKRKTSDKYSKDSLASAIEAVHSGDTIRKAVNRFVIPYTTLKTTFVGHMSKKEAIQLLCHQKKRSSSFKPLNIVPNMDGLVILSIFGKL